LQQRRMPEKIRFHIWVLLWHATGCNCFRQRRLNFKDANTEENDKNTKHPVIHLIPSQKDLIERRAYGGTMRLGNWDAKIKPGTRAYEIYKNTMVLKMRKRNCRRKTQTQIRI